MWLLLSTRSLVLCALLVLGTCAGGCGALAAILYKVGPPPTTPAKFKLGQELTAVVVENSRNPATTELDAIQIAALLRADLEDRKSAVVIDANTVQRLRDANAAAFSKMTITDIGHAVGVRQIVYVDLQRVTVETDIAGQMVRGHIEGSVRVVDVRTGANRWPTDLQQGYPLSFELPYTAIGEETTESRVRRALHDRFVLAAGRLFRDWVEETDHLQ